MNFGFGFDESLLLLTTCVYSGLQQKRKIFGKAVLFNRTTMAL